MTISKKTYLKNALKDYHSRSINPPIVRASTILFKSYQEIRKAQKQKQIFLKQKNRFKPLFLVLVFFLV